MAYQETIERDGGLASPAAAKSRNMADFAHGLTTIVELQAKLFVTEAKEAARGLVGVAALAAVATILLTAMVVVGLLGIAYWIAGIGDMSLAASHGLAAGAAAVTSVLFVTAAWILGRNRVSALQRSTTELERNIAWVKRVFQSRGSANPNRSRCEE